ncbi:MAG TPA: leucine--tRNA ligase, partial [Planctomycetaceae bacterium]|nr:leucine--tRNA ligase [Planctomycetaceae bacterium]
YDWSRELATTDPEYFRWTQWIFLRLFDTWYDADFQWTDPAGKSHMGKGLPIAELPIPDPVRAAGSEAVRRYQDKHRLAYQTEAPVNWCPALGTVLANEEIIDGKSERGGHPVVRIPLRQWMLRITAYAERLLDDLDTVDWPESIKLLQRNWIGRSEGAEVDFFIGGSASSAISSTSPTPAAINDFQNWNQTRAKSGFPREAGSDVIRIYTTRPDTLFGATYMVLAPEHSFVERLTSPSQKSAVETYCRQAATKSDLDRTDLAKEKTGVFTGSFAINPVNGEPIPIWIADYVLISYGTGAIMAVPAHDLRDWAFAVKFGLRVVGVVQPPADYEPNQEEKHLAREVKGRTEWPFAGVGTSIASGSYNGLSSTEFKEKITNDLASQGLGRRAVNYRLRDWLFSRQHFWGEPFPIWHELDASGNPTGLLRTDPESELPVTLPEMRHYKPHGRPEPPLAEAPPDWRFRTDKDGTRLARETNTMPQWAGSCWYYLRFIDPKNHTAFVDPAKEKAWMPVDLYIGGAEHAVLHLLYSRFWHKVLFDRGHVSTCEPFRRLVNQGMILGEAELAGYRIADGNEAAVSDPQSGIPFISARRVRDDMDEISGKPVVAVKLAPEQVAKKGNEFVLAGNPDIIVESRAFKMSKSRGNVVNPDQVVADYGADALRLYEMFMGPLEATKPWSMSGVEGVSRFLARVWRMISDEGADEIRINPAIQDAAATPEQTRLLHKTIQAVTNDIESLSFNTAISRMMEFVNAISVQDPRPRTVIDPFVLLLAPFAPHLAEELWQLLGHAQTLAYEPWPAFDAALLVETEVEIPVQINGKVRGKVRIPVGADQEAAVLHAKSDARIAEQLTGKQIIKVIYVQNRLLSFVVK